MSTVLQMDSLIPIYKRWPVHFVSGRGATLFDADGRAYIDLVAGIGVASVGHSHPMIAEAIAAQARELIHVSNLYLTGPQAALAERLAGLTGGKLSFFCNSGAEAIECALKLARRWGTSTKGPRATEVIAAEGSFHGRTFGALAATGQPAKRAAFEPMLPGFTHVPFGDAAAIAEALHDEVAAVLLEPIQGEGGVIVPDPEYLTQVRALCDAHGALLIVDEVQTGLARTGRWFAYQHFGVTPDVICLAKALAGGLPIGACLASPQVAQHLQPGDHASTFGGGPVQCSAALAVLDVIEQEGLVERATIAGGRIMTEVTDFVPSGTTVRGMGLLIGIEFDRTVARDIAQAALDRGVLVNDATPNVVRICPPLVIGDSELDQGLAVLCEVIDAT